MDFLQQILDHSPYSMLTAFILGLMTAISPCPLATNITAIGYISRNIENKSEVFVNGLIYTLGRAFSYVTLAILIFAGVSKLNISMLFQGWGERLLGPLLILIGLFMLDIFSVRLLSLSRLTEAIGEKSKTSRLSTFLLGVVFALAFCPYSAVLYFAMLIPITVASASGLYLSLVFAVATALPVIFFAWLLAFAVGSAANMYKQIKRFEYWFRRCVALVFIGVGMYYLWIFFAD